MALNLDSWKIDVRPGGWLRLREMGDEDTSIYLHYEYGGPAGRERLSLRSVVMRSESLEPLTQRTWRRVPLMALEQRLEELLALPRVSADPAQIKLGQGLLDVIRSGAVKPPSLDALDAYFNVAEDPTAVAAVLATDMFAVNADHAGQPPKLDPPTGRLTDEFLADLAKVYGSVSKSTRSPAPVIAEMTNLSVRTVHRWIYEARKRGIIPPARSGRAG